MSRPSISDVATNAAAVVKESQHGGFPPPMTKLDTNIFKGFETMNTTTIFAIWFMLMACMAVGMTFGVVDYTQRLTKALANGAAAVVTDGIDLGHGTNGRLLADMEFIVEAPAMNVTEMPNAKTMIYSIETDDDSAFGSATVVNAALITQTGAGGAGCAAQTKRFRLPTNCERYVRIKATGSAAGDATTATMAFRPLY